MPAPEDMPTISKLAPAFSANTSTGETIPLKSLHGHFVILYFYPKDNTSGCTRKPCSLRDAFPHSM